MATQNIVKEVQKTKKSAQKTLNHSHLGAVLGTGLEVKGKKNLSIWNLDSSTQYDRTGKLRSLTSMVT